MAKCRDEPRKIAVPTLLFRRGLENLIQRLVFSRGCVMNCNQAITMAVFDEKTIDAL